MAPRVLSAETQTESACNTPLMASRPRSIMHQLLLPTRSFNTNITKTDGNGSFSQLSISLEFSLLFSTFIRGYKDSSSTELNLLNFDEELILKFPIDIFTKCNIM